VEKCKLADLLKDAESLSEEDVSSLMIYEKVGKLIQDELFNHSFSAAKAQFPVFFTSHKNIRALFMSICMKKDIFYEVETNLASEMKWLDEYLYSKVKEEVYQTVANGRAQGRDSPNLSANTEKMYFSLFF
jgi:hypothetical protein